MKYSDLLLVREAIQRMKIGELVDNINKLQSDIKKLQEDFPETAESNPSQMEYEMNIVVESLEAVRQEELEYLGGIDWDMKAWTAEFIAEDNKHWSQQNVRFKTA